jgi:hypothetical protein
MTDIPPPPSKLLIMELVLGAVMVTVAISSQPNARWQTTARDEHMSDAASYAREKLFQAVDTLLTGSGRVQERLGTGAIKLLSARPEDIPYDDLRRTYVGVIDDLT